MKLPRRLAKTADGRYCEENDPEAAFLVGPQGMEIADIEAERLGITAYYEQAEVKALEQGETEDKAVDQATTEDKGEPGPGVQVDPATRRRRGVTPESHTKAQPPQDTPPEEPKP